MLIIIKLFIATLTWQWISYVMLAKTFDLGVAFLVASGLSALSHLLEKWWPEINYGFCVILGFIVMVTGFIQILIWTGNMEPHIFG